MAISLNICLMCLQRNSDISTRQSRQGSITLTCLKYLNGTKGGRTFVFAALKEWNKLPINIKSSQNVKVFKMNYANFFTKSYTGLTIFQFPKLFITY